ncbi:MAG: hypothetical protein ACNY01_07065 [Desulfobacteria bacterium]
MQDDFIASLTYEVREEVVERYFYERRLIELQIDHIHELARKTRKLEKTLHRCFAHIYEFLIDDSSIMQFDEITSNKRSCFVKSEAPVTAGHRLSLGARICSLTGRRKFKRLLFAEYEELEKVAQEYESAYEDMKEECEAVCHNIRTFQKNHDVMIIIGFLKSMDTELLVKKHFLGDNFSPEEIGSVDQGLAFKRPRIEQFQLTPPPEIPSMDTVAGPLTALASAVYDAHTDKIKRALRQL